MTSFTVLSEVRQPVQLDVKGDLPTWINGTLLRTGPGQYEVDSKTSGGTVKMKHWFDGLSINSAFTIKDGKVTYRSRYSTDALKKSIESLGRYPSVSFGEIEPCRRLFSKLFTVFRSDERSPDPSSVNVGVTIAPDVPWAKDDLSGIVVKTDSNSLMVIDPETLEPRTAFDYSRVDAKLDGELAPAHSHQDGDDYFSYVSKFGPKAGYKVFKIDGSGKATILATITDAPMAYIHSFFLTKKYVVLCVWQCDFAALGLPVLWHKNVINSFRGWDKHRSAYFYVIDRAAKGVVAKRKAPAFFAFHSVNAFDDPSEEGTLHCDVSAYDTNAMLEALSIENMENLEKHAKLLNKAKPDGLRRYTLRGIGSETAPPNAEISHPCGKGIYFELPVTAPAVRHLPYRFAYGISREGAVDTILSGSILKLDLATGRSIHWVAPDKGSPGEPIFLPRPGGKTEDDGVLLVVVFQDGMSHLVVLDATTMTEIASADINACVGLGFHGSFAQASL
ncbi:uncharacterized protein L969DRAFT_18421 [Mixia osmundae IAM 14324]|uniref:Uncharacterized protein n=1 Tax=Mixia osmundae (strain CBS 9802 / IAM 14324 / JCM 22182 / KY 12970) TaxID=764103 RepID=G7E7J5_MIXOS|nr:uncharacterized protein L969DRAFT_18421 [Mixia osmundae IAM 14324]KEI38407.1 hypothetical protein L969DRAFT_18421 [Mixia osmundae IAM 14324]GAA98805.1 hypothetical protein E5Q_05493 [Mixia osmundae IAM 14324]